MGKRAEFNMYLFIVLCLIIIMAISLGCANKSSRASTCSVAGSIDLVSNGRMAERGGFCAPQRVYVPAYVYAENRPRGVGYAVLRVGEYYWCYSGLYTKRLRLRSMRQDERCSLMGFGVLSGPNSSILHIGESIELVAQDRVGTVGVSLRMEDVK